MLLELEGLPLSMARKLDPCELYELLFGNSYVNYEEAPNGTQEKRAHFECCSHLALSCLLWSVAAVLETAKILVLQRISDAPTGIDQLHIRKNQSSN